MNRRHPHHERRTPLRTRLAGSSLRRAVAFASVLNVTSTGVSAVAGVLIARLLGPTMRGDYAAITAWYAAALVVGELGQPAAICYFVAHEPDKATDYVATSRSLMLISGVVVAIAGIFIAQALTNGQHGVTAGYRMAFIACPIVFMGASYLFALQARNIRHWAVISAVQPVAFLILIGGLTLAHAVTLTSIVIVLIGSSAAQAVVAYALCRKGALSGGHPRRTLYRTVLRYGYSQILATAPTTINITLDELFLSQTVAAANLADYAIAASITSLAYPLVVPIGSVLFPWIAAQGDGSESRRVQLRAVTASLVISSAVMAGVSLAAPWVVPFVFGKAYARVVPLVWILAPGGVFYTCSQVMGDLLRGQNRTLVVAFAQGIGAVCTVVLLFALVPIWNVRGAAITSSISYAVTFAIFIYGLMHNRGPVPPGPNTAQHSSTATA